MTSRRLRLASVLLALAVAVGACGDDDDGSSADDPTTTTASSSSSSSSDGTVVAERTPIPGFGEVEVRIVEGPDGEPIVICVLVADTPDQRARGLMEVTDLGGYDGMLFRFEDDSEGGFWMKDTVLPLSIAYLDADGAVVSTADMDPCPEVTARCPSYPAEGPYRMALEVEQGGLDPLGLVEGADARLEVTADSCRPVET